MGRLRIGVISAALTLAAAMTVLPMQVANAQPSSPAIVLPSNSATLSGTHYLDATGASGATTVQYELTGGSLSDQVIATATATIVGWAAVWNTTTVLNGAYTLNSVASYSGGVTETSTSVSLTVNNPPPSTTVVFPASGATLDATQTQYFDAVASSPGVTEVTIDLTSQDGGTSFTLSTTPTYVGWIGVIPGSPVESCGPFSLSYSIQSVASYAGGVSGTSASVPVTVDDVYTELPGGGC